MTPSTSSLKVNCNRNYVRKIVWLLMMTTTAAPVVLLLLIVVDVDVDGIVVFRIKL